MYAGVLSAIFLFECDRAPSSQAVALRRGAPSRRNTLVEKSLQYFEVGLGDADGAGGGLARQDIDAVMGKVGYLELKRNYAQALDLLNWVCAQTYFAPFSASCEN